jgi:hypothetical protein
MVTGSDMTTTTGVEDGMRFLLSDMRQRGDGRLFDYGMALEQKLFSVKLIYRTCKASAEGLFAAYKTESEDKETILMNETYRQYRETATYFEAFLHAVCSTFDVLAKFASYLYPDNQEVPK